MLMRNQMSEKFSNADKMAFILLLIIAFVLYYGKQSPVTEKQVRITIPEKEMVYSLDRDRILKVKNAEIEISDGRVRIVRNICRGQNCVRKGFIEEVGEFILCSPEKIYITIEKKSRDGGLDGTTW